METKAIAENRTGKTDVKKEGFSKLDTNIMKGTAVLMMLFHHLFTYDYRLAEGVGFISLGSYYGSKYETILGAFAQLCVALFLVLGGYGTWISWQHAGDHRKKWLEKIGKLYVGFWKVFVVFIPIAVLLQDPLVVPVKLPELLQNIFALNLTYNEEWWFLTPYLLLTAVFPLIAFWLGRKHHAAALDAGMIVAAQILVLKALPLLMQKVPAFSSTLLWQQIYAALSWAGPFLMGCLAARQNWFARARELVENRPLRWACALGVLAAVFLLRVFGGQGDMLDCIYAPLFVAAADALLRGIPVVRTGLAAFGTYSMPIWLIHSFYCYHFCQAFVYSLRWPILIWALLAAMSFATAWLMEKIYALLSKAIFRMSGRGNH